MAEELGGGEAGGSDQIFASAKYYFPILICTRKETSKEPGKMLCKVVIMLCKVVIKITIVMLVKVVVFKLSLSFSS